ncbi:hypothetical protein Y032_0018g3553 [Ancylostoma ceylanicum]|uniref:Uncharacterized protein n=1 Tax=Ancylostoma ceylanicum TaxID=53326 RepID=A0A016V2X6_9BILA|nr:hypothetical protein Y032_0018g3553 [Ancylostoma ceylanicum]
MPQCLLRLRRDSVTASQTVTQSAHFCLKFELLRKLATYSQRFREDKRSRIWLATPPKNGRQTLLHDEELLHF